MVCMELIALPRERKVGRRWLRDMGDSVGARPRGGKRAHPQLRDFEKEGERTFHAVGTFLEHLAMVFEREVGREPSPSRGPSVVRGPAATTRFGFRSTKGGYEFPRPLSLGRFEIINLS